MIIKTNKSFRELLKNIKPQDVVYPGILLAFSGIVIIMFFFATQFISKNINKIFYSEEAGATEALNIERYKLVAKKLGIVVNIPKEGEATPVKVATVAVAPVSTSTSALDKKTITIVVKNSTKKSGVASSLAKALEDAGFKKPQTGNESKFYATTTVILKESQKGYADMLLEIVRKTYPEAVATTTTTGATDAVVIIGLN